LSGGPGRPKLSPPKLFRGRPDRRYGVPFSNLLISRFTIIWFRHRQRCNCFCSFSKCWVCFFWFFVNMLCACFPLLLSLLIVSPEICFSENAAPVACGESRPTGLATQSVDSGTPFFSMAMLSLQPTDFLTQVVVYHKTTQRS